MKIIISFLYRILSIILPYKRFHHYRVLFSTLNSYWINRDFRNGGGKFVGEPFSLIGPEYISVGKDVIINKYVAITAIDKYRAIVNSQYITQKFHPYIEIGDGTNIGAFNHISSINKIVIGKGVLTGKWVTIVDHNHGKLDDLSIMPVRRELYSNGPVVIEDNVWIGEKATILSNVRVGEGSVIGANSVVTKDIPPYSIVAGIPAKVIRMNANDRQVVH